MITVALQSPVERRNRPGRTRQTVRVSHCRGFTLIELLAAVMIIVVCFGLLLPAVQRNREASNTNQASIDIGQILTAENTYMGQHDQALGTLAQLGAAGLIDPTLSTGTDHGYVFTVGPSMVMMGGFTITAVPAAAGITGSLDLSLNQNGQVTSSPSQGADAAREAMFSDLDAAGAEALGSFLSLLPAVQRTHALTHLQDGFVQHRTRITQGFQALDLNGDGKVTITEILANQRLGSDFPGFLDRIRQVMQLGLGNEDVSGVPGVSLSDILHGRSVTTGNLTQVSVGQGASTLISPGANQLPAVQLSGACTGTVRGGSLIGGTFDALLPFLETPGTLAGTFSATNGSLAIHGALVGFYPPTPASPASVGPLNGFFLVTGGNGAGATGFGSGVATIDWGDDTPNGPFVALLTGDLSFGR